MTNALPMLTLAEMQKTPIADLRSIALYTTNRQYSIACDQMADAQAKYLAGDRVAMMAHVERAKLAHKHAQEDEHGQCMRVSRTAVVAAAVAAARR